MAILCAIQSGNWTTAGTWGVADATSLLLATTSASNVGTAATNSAAFTPGAITVSGFYLAVSGRVVANPTGTVTFSIAQGGTPVAGTSVTVNATDFPASTLSAQHTWMYFKFAAPVTLLAATAYTIRAISSVNAQIAMSTNGTANNWSRALVTTTTAAPASTDTMLISGEHTAAATFSAYTVTYDNTLTTTWGTVANTAIQIGVRGTLSFGVAGSTNYYMRLGGGLFIGMLGELNVGTSVNPMPSSSTAVIELTVASIAQFIITRRNLGNLITYGAVKQTWDFLAANAIVGATSLTLTTSNPTGWAANDNIAIAPTSTVPTAFDQRIISTVSGTTLTITAGLTNAKTLATGLYSAVECEIVNVTRNIRIIGATSALPSNISEFGAGTTSMYYTEMRFMTHLTSQTDGNTTYKYGCSMWDLSASFSCYNTTNSRNVLIENEVHFNTGAVNSFAASGAAGAINLEYRDCVSMRSTSGTQGQYANAGGGIYMTNCRVISGGLSFGNNSSFVVPTRIKDCTIKNNSGAGVSTSLAYANNEVTLAIFENLRTYLCGTGISATSAGWVFDTVNIYSCPVTSLTFSGSNNLFKNVIINAGTISPSTIGFFPSANSICFNNTFINCSSGVTTALSSGDIRINHSAGAFVDTSFSFFNCLFGSPTEISLQTSLGNACEITSARHDQTNGVHRTWKRDGTISSDSVIYDTTTPGTKSTRLTPLSTTQKLKSSLKSVAAKNGAFVTVSVKVRCSVVGDGVAYNGARPRLILQKNRATHIEIDDTVLATATVAANGAFETISGTIPTSLIDDSGISVFVDCDGTAGWVNVDSWRFS